MKSADVKKRLEVVHFLARYYIMIRLNIHEAKTHLSKYLARLAKGDTILLCKRNVPVAEIHSLPAQAASPRPIRLAKGRFQVPPEFHRPLPDEIMNGFQGEAE
jgi:antitoxin (DNA-binding transcriptional repressor) of toxin-antitoxin stability system